MDQLPRDHRSGERRLTIDCDSCAMSGSDACGDCVVTFICSRRPREAVVIDVAEVRALRALAAGGLVPELRHRPRRAVG